MDGGIGESLLLDNVLTGAAVGGGMSLLTGGNPLQGALMGGLGGGLTYGVKDFINTGATTAGKGLGEATAMKAPTVAGASDSGIGSLLSQGDKTFSFTPWEGQPAGQVGGWDPSAGITTSDTAKFTPIDTTGAPSFAQAPTPVQQAVQNVQAQAAPQMNYNPITGEPIRNLANSAYNVGQNVPPTEQSFLQKYKWPLIGGGLGLAALMSQQPKVPTIQGPNVPQFGLASNYAAVPNPTPVYVPKGYAEGGIADLASGGNMAPQPANVDFMGGDMYPMSQQQRSFYATPTQMPTSAQQAMASYEPKTNPLTGEPTANMAAGGIANLGGYSDGGRMLKGPGDGMSDSIPGVIGDKRPARLADGEFVVPADVVSHLGNGSTDAGAKQLYAMMDKVRQARTGRKSQGKQINPRKMMPA